MIKYILAISVIFSTQAFAKCADQSDMVFYHDDENGHFHIGWYKPCCYIVTIMEGVGKGWQEFRYGNKVLASSNLSEIHSTYFVHIYEGFKVYSWDDYQRIVYTKDKQCLEIENDTNR